MDDDNATTTPLVTEADLRWLMADTEATQQSVLRRLMGLPLKHKALQARVDEAIEKRRAAQACDAMHASVRRRRAG